MTFTGWTCIESSEVNHMQHRKTLTAIVSGVCIFVIVIDGKTAMAGAAGGIGMCIRSVIPALFPFFVLSNVLTSIWMGNESRLLRPIGRLFRIPPGAESLLIPAFLGGYPAGAQSIGAARRKHQLSEADARRMLAFCNNPGPAFLFGIIAPTVSSSKAWLLWGIQLVSALAVSLSIPAAAEPAGQVKERPASWPEAMKQAVSVTGSVCGWVILFRVLIEFLDNWFLWLLPDAGKTAVIGFLELANGCLSLPLIADQEARFLLCSAMLSFGGICVTLQTLSAAENADLSLYFPGKILQTAVSSMLACLLCPDYRQFCILLVPFVAVSLLILRKKENKCGNPATVGV